MKARLFTIPGSHPGWSARLMLERKGIPYVRTDLVAVVSKAILRGLRFPRDTVPALILDGRRIQGTREIARELDQVVPEPPLLPVEPSLRGRVEQAEAWGERTVQEVPRRIIWNVLRRDRGAIAGYLEGARLGIPSSLAAATAAPIIELEARINGAGDERVRQDVAALPGIVSRIDSLIAEGILGGPEPNAADLQIAPSLALLATLDDVRPLLTDRPAWRLVELVPDFPGNCPPVLPAAWLEPLRRPRPA